MSLPTELRLQIYQEVFISKPRESRMGVRVSGPVTCYSNRTFDTAILLVSREVHREAISIFYGATVWKLHVYLIFEGDEIYGSDVASALCSLACSERFSYLRTCVLDVRLFRGKSKKNNAYFSGVDALRANIETARKILSRADLREIEVSWRNYCDHDLTELRCRSLEPLDKLPITYNLSINKVVNTLEGSDEDLTCWPDMLKAFRVMLSSGPQGSIQSLHAPGNPLISTNIQHLV